MQCKDIPTEPILAFLGKMRGHLGETGTLNSNAGALYPNSVHHGMPAGLPQKLVKAKMASLLRRGLVDGCVCGCRGDFELTARGRALSGGTP